MIRPGRQVLDVACGRGRHAIAAAKLGADVVAIDQDADRMEQARETAAELGLSITWKCSDLKTLPLPADAFDLVLVFNYLDRDRITDLKNAVRPGGHLVYETFLQGQQAYGWGPSSEDFLLAPGELAELVQPFEVEYGREVVEVVDSRSAVVASIVARRL